MKQGGQGSHGGWGWGWRGGQEGMRNRVILTDSGWEKWCQFSGQGHCMFPSQYSLVCCKGSVWPSVSPRSFRRCEVHVEKSWKIAFLCTGHVTYVWRGPCQIREAERRKRKEVRRREKGMKEWKNKDKLRGGGKKEVCIVGHGGGRRIMPPAALEQGQRPEGTTSEDTSAWAPGCFKIHLNCWFFLPSHLHLSFSSFLWLIIAILAAQKFPLSPANPNPRKH